MSGLRAIPRSSFALVLSALMLSTSIMFAAVYTARGDQHDQTFYGCLFAGSLSQVNTDGPPVNCGRGQQVSWNSQGIQGLPGEPGVDGIDGVSGYETVYSEFVTIEAGQWSEIVATCPVGKVALGGGVATIPSGIGLVSSTIAPDGDDRWYAFVVNDSETDVVTATAKVICAFMADPAP